MRRAEAAVGVVLVAACGSSPPGFLAFPSESSARSALLVERLPDHDTARAFSMSDELTLEAEESTQISLFLFPEPLTELGVERGPVRLAKEGELNRALPKAVGSYRLVVDAKRRSASWEVESRAPPLLWSDPSVCAHFETRQGLDLTAGLPYRGVVKLDERRVLLANDNELTILTDGVASTAPLPGPFGVWAPIASGGQIVYANAVGELWRGAVDGQGIHDAQQIGSVLGGAPSFMVGEIGAADVELYAVVGLGALHYQGGQWKVLGRVKGLAPRKLLWLPDRSALLATEEQSKIYRLNPSGLEEESLGPDPTRVATLALDPEGRALIGTYGSDVYRREARSWEKLFYSGTGWWVLGLVAYEDGLMVQLASGGVLQWRPSLGLCPEIFPDSLSDDGELFVLGRNLLMLATAGDHEAYSSHYLRRL